MITERDIPLPIDNLLAVTTDTTELARQINLRRARLQRLSPILRRVQLIMRQDFQQQFKQGGNPPWKPLAASTIAKKTDAGLPRRTAKGRIPTRLKQNGQFGPGNILIETGRLRDAWCRKDSPDHFESIDSAAGTVRVGPRPEFKLATWHQLGTRPRVIVPRNAKALAFMTQNGYVIRKSVKYPGLPARPVRITEGAIEAIQRASAVYFSGGGVDGNGTDNTDNG